jgi:uncharacterized protein (TIGR02284 family)
MSIETQQVLTPNMISQLQELIQINIDSRDGFRHASEVTDDLTLQSAFEQIAIDRDAQADELARFVAWSGEYPRRDGSIAAAVHRAWMTIRESLSTDDRFAVLCEAERGEDSIKAAYEKALESFASTAVSDVLLRQYAAVNFSHDRIRDLRDSCAG